MLYKSKKIKTYSKGNRKVVVRFNYEWDEYRCYLWIDTIHQVVATYYTDDKQDALDSAMQMVVGD